MEKAHAHAFPELSVRCTSAFVFTSRHCSSMNGTGSSQLNTCQMKSQAEEISIVKSSPEMECENSGYSLKINLK